jgi:WD40 repeat protein
MFMVDISSGTSRRDFYSPNKPQKDISPLVTSAVTLPYRCNIQATARSSQLETTDPFLFGGANGTTIWENKHAHAKPRGGSIGTSLSIARKSNILISGGIDGAVKAWAAQNGQLIKSLRDNGPAITSITISNDEETIAAGNQAGYISIWDLASFQLLRSFEADSGEINSLAFSPDKHFLVSGGNDGVIKFWNTASGALDKTLEGHSKPVKSIVFSIDGRFIATGGNDSIVKIWNAFDDHLITEFKGHSGWVESIAFSPDGKRIASGGRDGRILIWDTENKRIAAILSNFDFFDWLVVNSEGYFNTGLDASKTLIIHTNGRSYSLEPYFQLFFSPENVKRALAGETVAKANLSRLDLPPPSINILSPLDSALIEQDVVAVTISAKDRGGGVEKDCPLPQWPACPWRNPSGFKDEDGG